MSRAGNCEVVRLVRQRDFGNMPFAGHRTMAQIDAAKARAVAVTKAWRTARKASAVPHSAMERERV